MDSAALSNAKFDVYRAITEKIVAAIKAGALEYRMPWHGLEASVAKPTNALTKKPYRGINVLSLWADGMYCEYETGYWATYRQWQTLGAQVRKHSRGSMIVFFKRETIEGGPKPSQPNDQAEDEADEPRSRLIARASRVFNADQVDGWTPPEMPVSSKVNALVKVETFVASTGARIAHGGDACRYNLDSDTIHIVDQQYFVDTDTSSATESYYATLLHELTHWTGAAHRLAREFGQRFGDNAYAMEELVAELGSAFLCADLEITNEPRADHAGYVYSWLNVLEKDSRAIFTAASKASQSAEYLSQLTSGGLSPLP